MLTAAAGKILLDRLDDATERLAEAITRKTIDRLISPLSTSTEASIAKIFIRQGYAVVKKLKPLEKYLKETVKSDFDDLFDEAIIDTSADMQDQIDHSFKRALGIGGRSLLAEFRSGLNFSLTNPRAVSYTETHAAEAIAGIDDTSKADIRRLVALAVEHGTSYADLARQIKARYHQYAVGVPQKHIRSRAELIAVTEVGNGYQAGNFAAARMLEDDGLTLEKYWFNSGDDRVSDGCKANTAANWIDLNEAFPSGDMTPLRFPGCRCATQYRRKKSK